MMVKDSPPRKRITSDFGVCLLLSLMTHLSAEIGTWDFHDDEGRSGISIHIPQKQTHA